MISGSWWGYRVSNGVRPYVYSTAFGILPVALATFYGAMTRFRRHRGWWLALTVSVITAAAAILPGAHQLWDAMPVLHIGRYPIKALLIATLAVCVLSAYAFDALSALATSSDERRRASQWFGGAAILSVLLAIGVFRNQSAVVGMLTRTLWDPLWRGDIDAVLASWPSMVVARLFGVGAVLITLFFWTARQPRLWMHTLLILVLVADLTICGRHLLPTIAPQDLGEISTITWTARQTGGRVFERVFKDLDVPLYGLFGAYPEDHVRSLALAQRRQAWALSGAADGLRYAYDSSVDGSYTWRNQIVAQWIDSVPWPLKVKWLRAVGVTTVIASNVTEPLPGLRPVLRDAGLGVPITLYAIEPRLGELRAPRNIRWVNTPEEAFSLFSEDRFDERDVLIEGVPVDARDQPEIAVRLIRSEPDRVVFESSAGRAGFVFLARSHTRQVRASTASMALRVLPANVHLCAIEVAAGTHVVTVTF
jgi:hypothetical protein